MTKFLEKAFSVVAKLPEPAQDRLAAHLQELANDAKSDAAFAASATQLEQLAAQALNEYRTERTEEPARWAS